MFQVAAGILLAVFILRFWRRLLSITLVVALYVALYATLASVSAAFLWGAVNLGWLPSARGAWNAGAVMVGVSSLACVYSIWTHFRDYLRREYGAAD